MKLKDGKICGCKECKQDHCDLLCRQEWYTEKRRRKNRQKRADKALFRPLSTCELCGKLYIKMYGDRQRFCSPECSHIVFREKYRKDYIGSWWGKG
jgi:predicted nucleic acid-binding Zn ribbon protein